MKERFDYKPSITSILINTLCILGGLVALYFGIFKETYGTGTFNTLILSIASLWTLYFAYSVFKDSKELASKDACLEIDSKTLSIKGKIIPLPDFNYFKTVPTSDDMSSELFMYGYNYNGSETRESLTSDNFGSKEKFDDFLKLVVHHSGKEIEKPVA